MKKLFYIAIVFVLLIGCEKQDENVSLRYRVSKAISETEITYREPGGNMVTKEIAFNSSEDIWQVDFEAKHGEIVFLSAVYQDSASSVNVQILIDGKVYKEGSSVHEPQKTVIVSGTIAY